MSYENKSFKTDNTTKPSNIILAIIYFNQNFKFNINKDLIFEKFKTFEVIKIKVISKENPTKALIQLSNIENSQKIVNTYHKTNDFYGKWKVYFSRKKKIIITKNESLNNSESVYDANAVKIQSKLTFQNSIFTPFNKNNSIKTKSTLTPQFNSNFKNKNEYNFNKLSNLVLENYKIKKVIYIKALPEYLNKLNEIYNFFSLFGNIDILQYNNYNNEKIIIYDDLFYEEKLKFLKFIDIFNLNLKFSIIDYDDNLKNNLEFQKFKLKNKYDRYIKNKLISWAFPSNIIKIINIDNSLNIFNLQTQFLKIKDVRINCFKEVVKNRKKRFYFQFSDFLSTIKIISIFHLKKVIKKKLFIQLTSRKINL